MNDPNQEQDKLIDPTRPGKARTIYAVVAILVVVALIAALGGTLVWDRLF